MQRTKVMNRPTKEANRSTEYFHWLDNLRTLMIFLVVVLHAGLVYESSGISAFFWIVDDPATNDLVGIINLVLDLFVMSIIFFVSGFLAPRSLHRRGGTAFLMARIKRLMIPWVVAVLTLIPLYKVIFLYSRNLPQQEWTTYFHWSNGIWGQNWLWFLPVLFLFNLVYWAGSKIPFALSKISFKTASAAAFFLALVYSLSLHLSGGLGWTKTFLFDFQNERILIYFMVFVLGSMAYKQGILNSLWSLKGRRLAIVWTAWIPIFLYIIFVIHSLINPGNPILSPLGDPLMIQLASLLSLVCLMYLFITYSKRYLNQSGSISRELSKNSYGVYIVHTIVLGGIALVLLETALPSLVKDVILISGTYLVSNFVVSGMRTAWSFLKNIRRTRIPEMNALTGHKTSS